MRKYFIGFATALVIVWVEKAPLFAVQISMAESNLTIDNDRFPPDSKSRGVNAMGDFNGDGNNDIALLLGGDIDIFLGGSVPSGASVKNSSNLHILLPSEPATDSRSMAWGDLNNDGRDDLIVGPILYLGQQSLFIIFGRQSAPQTLDLIAQAPDLVARGDLGTNVPLAVGDVTGDAIADLVCSNPNASPLSRSRAGIVFVLPGRSSFSSGIIDLGSDPSVNKFYGSVSSNLGNLGTRVQVGDFNGDAVADLALTESKSLFSVPLNKQIYEPKVRIIFGKANLQTTWDLSSKPADVTLVMNGIAMGIGSYYAPSFSSNAGDFTREGKADLLLSWTLNNRFCLLSGDLLTPGATLNILDGSSTTVAMIPIAASQPEPNVFGDFDGDGWTDLILSQGTNASILLNKSFGTTNFPPVSFSSTTINNFVVSGFISNLSMGDVNGDGKGDLVVFSWSGSTVIDWGSLHVFYGFIPLETPSIQINGNSSNAARVTATLNVIGEPTEMRLSGDISDSFRDQWIPYRTSMPVTLSPAVGQKTVRATFRNSAMRESATAEDTVGLTTTGSDKTEIFNNLLRPEAGSKVSIDCALSSSGHLKADVYSRTGEHVASLVDEERSAGIWPIEWNGTNGAGQRVAPGIYILIIENNNGKQKVKVVVQG